MVTDYTAGDPIQRRHYGRQPGESYRDAIDRLAGQLRATELDRDRARTEATSWKHRAIKAEAEVIGRDANLRTIRRNVARALKSCDAWADVIGDGGIVAQQVRARLSGVTTDAD